MKYKKELASIIFLALVVLIGGAVFLSNLKLVARNPFNNKYKFIFPDRIAADSKENIYMVDNGWKRITKMDKSGKVLFTIEGGVRDKNRFYLASDVAVDEKDNLYVWNYIFNKNGSIEYEEIKKYNESGKFEKIVLRFNNLPINNDEEKDENKSWIRNGEQLQAFCIQKKEVLFLVKRHEEKNSTKYRIELYKTDGEKTHKLSELKTISEIVDMKASENGKVYITEISGKLFEIENGNLEPVEEANLIKKPWGIGVDKNGNVFFSDVLREDIVKINGDKADVFVGRKKIYDWVKSERIVIKNIGVSRAGRVYGVDESTNSIICADTKGEITKVFREGYYPFSIFLFVLIMWGILLATLLLTVYIIRRVYRNILNKKLPIVMKQLLIFIPVIIISITYISTKIYNDFYVKYEESVKNQLLSMAQAGAKYISADAVDGINSPADCGGNAHQFLKRQMESVIGNGEWNSKLYSVIYKVKNNRYYIIGARNDYFGTFFPFSYIQTAHKNAYEKGQISYAKFSDSMGEWMIAAAPIRDSNDKIVAVYEIGMNSYVFKEANEKFVKYLIVGVSLVVVIFIFIFFIFSYIVLNPLKTLRDAVTKLSAGDYEARVDIKTRDEVGELCGGFNTMANHIKNYIGEINELNKIYFKFVPKEFIHFIDKKNITDIRLGDQTQREMTIMFTDIRAFTTLSETMTPKENFDFINAYLRRVGPVIRKYGGFIDKYIGDAIMAIFPSEPEAALKAIIEIKDRIEEYNITRIKKGYKPISIGTGVHTGMLMFGIVGEEERIAGTVISDNVNLSSRLEGLTKQYGAMAIVSGYSIKLIKEAEKYNIRFLGKVTVKGKTDVIEIYEVVDSKNSETGKLKMKNKQAFENAVKLYYEKKIENAFEEFTKIYNENRYDKAAYLYITRCKTIIESGISENWDGVEKMIEK